MNRMFVTAICICLALACSIPSPVHPAGFGIFTQGASALGQADSVVAHTDSPSTVFFNPALMSKLGGTQVEAGTTLLIPSREFKSDLSGRNFRTKHEVFLPPTFYVTHAFQEKVSIGFGVFSPFGLSTKWGDDWEGRYVTTNSEIKTFAFNPAVSYKVIPRLSVAAGLDILTLDAALEKMLNLSALGLPDISQRFHGSGTGTGYNLGLLLDLPATVSVGASYRSPIRVKADGDISHRIPTQLQPGVGGLFPTTHAGTTLKFPPQLTAGVSCRPLPPVIIEAGFRWEGWSTIDVIRFDLGRPVAGATSLQLEKKWKDTYSFLLGADYEVNKKLSLRAGYLYGTTAAPRETFDPSLPDADTHLFSLGARLTFGNLKADLVYSYQKLVDRKKENTVDDNPADGVFNPAASANGRYRSDLNMIGFSLSYLF